MLDFASLNQARQGLEVSNELRHKQSLSLYEQGRGLIREALGRPIDKAKLKQAVDCFTKGIQSNYKQPANYLGLAFINLLTGQAPRAIPLIRRALEFDPESSLAKDLLEQAQHPPGGARHLRRSATAGPTAVPPADASPGPVNSSVNSPLTNPGPESLRAPVADAVAPVPEAFELDGDEPDIDFDALYDLTYAEIQSLLRQISSDESFGIRPSPDQDRLDLLKLKQQQFSETVAGLFRKLDILDDELDVNVLRRQMQAFDKVLARLNQQILHFEQFIAIAQDIAAQILVTERLNGDALECQDARRLPEFERHLQLLLDHCDSVADKIDALETARQDISSLHPRYTTYVERLETYQDTLEDLAENLKA